MIIHREIIASIYEHIFKPEITMLVGSRQVGKTTIITEIANRLKQQNKKVAIFNLDIEDDFSFFTSQSKLINHLKLKFADEYAYIFVDEVQRKEDAGRFFKGLYDMKLPYKFILTGSGSVELKEKISESLAGRKRLFEIFPISFTEFLDFKTNYAYSQNLTDFILSNDPILITLLHEYLRFGGYPKIITTESLEQKTAEMQEIYTSYLEKDIFQLLKIKKTDSFQNLLTLLAAQLGNGINITELSNTLNLDIETTKNYLWYLEKTYIIQICKPFYTNVRSELSKTPIAYFVDTGIRNYILNRFSYFNINIEGGHLFENFILNHLKTSFKDLYPTINYWRTKDGAEIDFIFKVGLDTCSIEAKFKNFKTLKVGKSVYSFIDKYSPQKALIINLNFNEKTIIEKTNVEFMRFTNFITQKNLFTN